MTIRKPKTIKRLGLVVFLSFIAMVVLPIAVAAASCTATPNYDENGVYTGCTTNVNGHEQTSTPEGLTELGCSTFCSALEDRDGFGTWAKSKYKHKSEPKFKPGSRWL